MRTAEEITAARRAAVRKYKSSPKYREWRQEYYSRPEVKERERQKVRAWQSKPENRIKLAPGKRAFNLMDKYGITVERYESMLAEQNGGCAICGGQNENGRRLTVDHNHATGKVRGLLCGTCNRTVGNLKDSVELASKTADYIREHEGI